MPSLAIVILDESVLKGRDDRSMVVENLEVAQYSRHLHALHLTVIFHPIRGHYSKFQHDTYNLWLWALSFGLLHQSLTFLDGILDGTHVEEGLFGQIIDLSVEDHVESLDGVLDGDHDPLDARELLSHGEGL